MNRSNSRILTLAFTDLVSSTALKTEHGDQVAGRLVARHREHVQRLAQETEGRIVDWAGDGCFLTFDIPSAAVMFALELQCVHGDERDLPRVRIGIHIGEVSDHASPSGVGRPDVDGLAVDLAARIAGLAEANQILLSAAASDSSRSRVQVKFRDRSVRWQTHDSYNLKGFDKPVEICEVGLEGLAPFKPPTAGEKAWPVLKSKTSPSVGNRTPIVAACLLVLGASLVYFAWWNGPRPNVVTSAQGLPVRTNGPTDVRKFDGRPAIAVLPFDNLSTDPEQAFFADGLAEDLITRLASWRAFPVIARNSSFQYRGGDLDLKRVGAELGARYLVEGSVRRVGDRIRVTAQLIDTSSAEHVWAANYDRAVVDVFALQDEIGSTIAASLVNDLTRAEGERARQQGTENLEAWSFYQLGLQHADRYTAEDSREAAKFFERALELDPRFSTAMARLAMEHWMMAAGDGRVASERQLSDALATARRAVELDPRDPVAHAALGSVYLAAGDPVNAIDATRNAVELNPSMPEAWIWFGWAQLLAGDPQACISATERARELNPQGPMIWVYDSLALANWETGRYDASLEAGRRLVAASPTYFTGYLYVAMSTVSLGRLDEARAAIAEGRRVRPDLSIDLMQNYLAVSRPEMDARRDAALRKAGLE